MMISQIKAALDNIQDKEVFLLTQTQSWLISLKETLDLSTCLELLNNQCEFYACQVIIENLKRDRFIDPLLASSLTNHLFTHTLPPFVVTKILVAIAILCIKLNNLSFLHVRTPDNLFLLTCKLDFLYLIPQEANDSPAVIYNNLPFVLDLCFNFINHEDPSICEKSILCLSSWIGFGSFPLEIIMDVSRNVLKKCINSALLDSISELILSILKDSRVARLENQIPFAFISSILDSHIPALIDLERDDEDVIMNIAKIICQTGETFARFIGNNITNPLVLRFLELVLFCTEFPSKYPSNSEISQMTFYFWFLLQDLLDEKNDLNPRILTFEQKTQSVAIFQKLNHVVFQQATYPDQETLDSWPSDYRIAFTEYRMECSDALLQCYYFLDDYSLVMSVNGFMDELRVINNGSRYLQVLESHLFCVKSYSESVPLDSVTVRPIFAESIIYLGQIDSTYNGVDQLRRTMLNTIIVYSEWLAENKECLSNCFQYILTALKLPIHAELAAKCLLEFSRCCREALAVHLDPIMDSLMGSLGDVDVNFRGKVIQSIISVVQCLEDSARNGKFVLILQQILSEISTILAKVAHEPNYTYEMAKIYYDYIHSCCKGCDKISPEMLPSLMDINVGKEFCRLIQQTLEIWPRDCEMSEKVSDLLVACQKSQMPIFKYYSNVHLEIIANQISVEPKFCWLQAATSIATIEKPVIDSIVNTLTNFMSDADYAQQNPDVAAQSAKFMTHVLHTNLQLVITYAETRNIFEILLKGLVASEPMVVISSAHFFLALVKIEYQSSDAEPFLMRILDLYGKQIVYNVLYSIGNGLPSTLNSIGDVLYQMLVLYPNQTRDCLYWSLSTAGFPSEVLSPEDKNKIAQDILSQRKVKHFRDVIKAFSAKCKSKT